MADSKAPKLTQDQLRQITLDISEDLLKSGIEKASQTAKKYPSLSGSEVQLFADVFSQAYTVAVSRLAYIAADDSVAKHTIQRTHKAIATRILQRYNDNAQKRDQSEQQRIIKP